MRASGDETAALSVLREAERIFPASQELIAARVRLHFHAGSFALAANDAAAYIEMVEASPEMVLLRARALWANGEWRESLALYEAFLDPPVRILLEKDFHRTGLILQLPEPNRGFLDRLLDRKPPGTQILDVVMTAEWLARTTSLDAARLITARYSRYRWQQRFAAELAARGSVERRDYYSAARQYRLLAQAYPETPSLLFDLAGVYSKLDQLTDEAAVYQELQAHDVKFPGLSEAVERNRLKRRPRVAASYGYQREKGYDGGKDT